MAAVGAILQGWTCKLTNRGVIVPYKKTHWSFVIIPATHWSVARIKADFLMWTLMIQTIRNRKLWTIWFPQWQQGTIKVKFWWRLWEVCVDERPPLTPGIHPLLDSPWPGGRTASRAWIIQQCNRHSRRLCMHFLWEYNYFIASLQGHLQSVAGWVTVKKNPFKYKAEEREEKKKGGVFDS